MSFDTLWAAGVGAGAGWLGAADDMLFFRFLFPSFVPPIVKKLLVGLADVPPRGVLTASTVGIVCPMKSVDWEGIRQFTEAEN